MSKEKNKSLLTSFTKLFSYQPKEQYHFSIPETSEELSPENSQKEASSITPPAKDIFPSISVNLEAITTRFNTLINSDIIIRQFSLIAKNKEYKAFLLYIDGMVDTTSINHFVLDPLMLRNMANTYQNQENETVKQAIAHNIIVRKVKKFDLQSYIFNHLVPQNSVKQTR
ncbi:MAG: spore germination protein [Clostridia bacterium]|nr:spore germination protein [Clostridia bacterium]